MITLRNTSEAQTVHFYSSELTKGEDYDIAYTMIQDKYSGEEYTQTSPISADGFRHSIELECQEGFSGDSPVEDRVYDLRIEVNGQVVYRDTFICSGQDISLNAAEPFGFNKGKYTTLYRGNQLNKYKVLNRATDE